MSAPPPSNPPASDGADAQLWARFVDDRDVTTRNRLIERYLPLCRSIAAAVYAKRGGLELEFLDYLQFGTLGLIEAVERFDPAQGAAFATFATPRIRGSILNNLEALSEQYTQIGLHRRLGEDRLESLTDEEPLAASPGRRRKRDLLGYLTELTVGFALAELLEGSGMLLGLEDEQSYRHEFYAGEAQRQLQQALATLVQALPEQERRVIQYHYYQGLEFVEIADLLGLSKGRISQIHRQALQLVREAYASVGRLDRLL